MSSPISLFRDAVLSQGLLLDPGVGVPGGRKPRKWRLPRGTALSATQETRCRQALPPPQSWKTDDSGSWGTAASDACPEGMESGQRHWLRNWPPFFLPRAAARQDRAALEADPALSPFLEVTEPLLARGSSGHGPDPGRRSEPYMGQMGKVSAGAL